MTSTSVTPQIDPAKLDAFVGRFVGDLGSVLHAATVLVGDELGLYRAMPPGDPITPAELAGRTGTHERFVAEWLAAQAAAGYVELSTTEGSFVLPHEQALALTDEYNPVFAPGGLQVAASTIKDVALVAEAFRTGEGVPWGRHHTDLFRGTERFFRPGYIANLLEAWIPALDGVGAKLTAGARVADVGCGHGASTIIMAEAFPDSTFVGFDSHPPSIEAARRAAADAGVAGNCSFEVGDASSFGGGPYDLVTFFDCLHDLGDPVGAGRQVRRALAPDGTWMIVEPQAGDRLEDNLNPVGRVFYAASTMICTPNSRSQDVGLAIGAQAGQRRLDGLVREAGFAQVRRAAETPFNMVLEARP
jgi:SAM-dependent methyltransferase